MKLADAVPRDAFSSMFSNIEERITVKNVREFLRAEPASASTTLLYVWDEMVHRGKVVNPSETMDYYPGPVDRLFSLVSRRLGGQPFADAFAADYFNEHSASQGDMPFAQIQLVRSYPSDIHIADVTFSDLTRPASDGSSMRSHRGLGIFGAFLEQLLAVARAQKAKQLSLVAASREAAETFHQYGFRASEAPASTFAAATLGSGHAMTLRV